MPQKFYNISLDEMDGFLAPQGFRPITVAGTAEIVYGKIINYGEHKLSLRVLTAIWPSGQSRDRGQDAIRVQVWIMYDGQPVLTGKTRNVKRIEQWRDNLGKAINEWPEQYKVCPACGWPMALRNGQYGEFWGCVTYHKTKCNGKAKDDVAAPQNVPVKTGAELRAASKPIKVEKPQPPAKEQPFGETTGGSLWERLMGTQKDRQMVAELSNRLPVPAKTPRVIAPSPRIEVATVKKDGFPKRDEADFIHHEMWEGPGDGLNKYRIEPWKISVHQKRSETEFRTTTKNIMMPARAGGGKTAMLKHLSTFKEGAERFAYLVFGAKNAADGRRSMPRGIFSMTTHTYLLRAIREEITGLPEWGTDNKDWLVMEKVYPSRNQKDRKRIRKAAFKLIGLSKNYAVRPGDMAGIKAVMDKYTFELDKDREVETAIEVVNEVLELSRPSAEFGKIFNCDDMLWWWVIMDLEPHYYDVALMDEVQDFNECQLEMVRRLLHRGTRVVAVGDPYQAVFRFRGADNAAYDKLTQILAADKRGCETILLPINYRCGRVIIEWVRNNTICKDIEAAPDAIEGSVREDMSYEAIIEMLAEEFSPMMAG